MEDYPGLPGGPSAITGSLQRKEGGRWGGGFRIRKRNEDNILLARKARDRAGAKNCRQPLAAGTGQRKLSLLQLLHTLVLAQ